MFDRRTRVTRGRLTERDAPEKRRVWMHRRALALFTIAFVSTQAYRSTIAFAQGTAPRAASAPAPAGSILGEWRFVRAVVAPWVTDAKVANPNSKGWIGKSIRFGASHVSGPGVLNCANAHYTPTRFQADALFQGSLPAPAKDAAESLGLVAMPVAGTSLDCDAGLFELHRADQNTLLFALDNVIWTLDRSPGSFAPDTSPAGVVQRLLERHFADIGFHAAAVDAITPWLSDGLRARIARYLAKPASPNETPAIDGDPFTDSQEYPTRFSVGLGVAKGGLATVTVRFGDGRRVRPVRYLLRLQRGAWRVDDLRYSNGETLGAWLR
ncbi:MAG: hypothetical protein ABIP93_12490 [Gemmatimonadaceae bacterium]